jgi:cytosine/adenosine deaminase-related metal-dependent hydrolase
VQFLSADFIITCDTQFNIYKNSTIVFDDKIIAIDTNDNIKQQYPDANIQYQGLHSVIMPGLINSHIHLEFSSNKTTLSYGNFLSWLYSVIQHRDDLINDATNDTINRQLKKMIKTGTTSIGAISSYGFDLEPCVNSALNVVYFTEALGSKADMIDTLFLDFKERLNIASKHKNDRFIPAIAIHSPYSTHPFLIREILKIAKVQDMTVSTHFSESKAENDWLNYNKGEFKDFFKNILKQSSSLIKSSEFLNLFKNNKNISFTHCVRANKQELRQIKELNGSIIHCATSNRLLTNDKLDLDYIKDINLSMGTDGLSSNSSLSMFDELRNAFYIHTNIDTNTLAKRLILASTVGSAKALNLTTKGSLVVNNDADIIVFDLKDEIKDEKDILTHIILHTKFTKKTFIKGQNALS